MRVNVIIMLEGFDTVLTADSVEWCPTAGLEAILGCGTYQLNKEDSTRLGSLTLFKWDGSKLSRILKEETKSYLSGNLDMKWKSIAEKSVLSTATSCGSVCFLQLEQVKNELLLSDLGNVELVARDGAKGDSLQLCLSLDWGKQTNSVAVSDSLGQIGVIEVCEAGLNLKEVWKAHTYEAWIVCFGHGSEIIFSGGDDSKLHQWDLRVGTSRPCLSSRWHNMGVCSLQIHPCEEHILGSGSYDEHLLLWDTRNMSKPFKDKSLGGGIWRIKWNHVLPNIASTACMHNNFSVVDCHLKSSKPIEVVDAYDKHNSLAYGIDWCRSFETVRKNDKEEDYVFTLASCSFYDHSLHLWTTSLQNKD